MGKEQGTDQKSEIHKYILDHDSITLCDQRTGRKNCHHKPSGLFDVIKSGINLCVKNITLDKIVGRHKRVFDCLVVQQINSGKGFIRRGDNGISFINDIRNTSIDRQVVFQHIIQMAGRSVQGDICLSRFSLIIKSCGSDIGHITIGFFLTFAEIKFRTEERRLIGTLKDTVPVGAAGFAHRRKIIFCQIIGEKPHRLRWKVHIDLDAGDQIRRNEIFGICLKVFGRIRFKKHLKRRIDGLMEQCLKKFLLRNSVMCINDFLHQFFYIRCSLSTGVLLLPDRIRDNHVI